MPDIKEEKTEKGTIKKLDKAEVMRQKLKTSCVKMKEKDESSSPTGYAVNKVNNISRQVFAKSRAKANAAGARSVKEISERLHIGKNGIKEKERIKGIRTKEVVLTNRSGIKERGPLKVKSVQNTKIKADARAKAASVKKLEKSKAAKQLAQRNIQKSIKNAVKSKAAARKITDTVKRTMLSAKLLMTTIFAGGWIAVLLIVVCCLFGAALYFFGDGDKDGYIPVSAEVEGYSDVIEKYASEYGIGEYTELVKTVMMQESGGKGSDPMQSSECMYNTEYPRKPNSITYTDYSIKCGVRYLASVMKSANVGSPVDMDNIKLALQGYNFGEGYISWALKKYGGYSKANAAEYSQLKAEENGWESYGDKDYADNVLRYYPFGNYSYDIIYNGKGKLGLPIADMTRDHISPHFGSRPSPGEGIGSTDHQGIDIAFPIGTKVLACEKGTVTLADWNGGYGKCIVIDHGKGLETVYGHLSNIRVRAGQKVVRGQVIGEVGNTGDSTGPHLHLGVAVDGKYVNPEKGWLSIN